MARQPWACFACQDGESVVTGYGRSPQEVKRWLTTGSSAGQGAAGRDQAHRRIRSRQPDETRRNIHFHRLANQTASDELHRRLITIPGCTTERSSQLLNSVRICTLPHRNNSGGVRRYPELPATPRAHPRSRPVVDQQFCSSAATSAWLRGRPKTGLRENYRPLNSSSREQPRTEPAVHGGRTPHR